MRTLKLFGTRILHVRRILWAVVFIVNYNQSIISFSERFPKRSIEKETIVMTIESWIALSMKGRNLEPNLDNCL
jgi:hypothetical protein